MTSKHRWQYNEMQQIGTDYQDEANVQAYDERMARLRDVKSEVKSIMDDMGITKESTVIEIGCGTGNFSVEASKHCKKVYSVDISEMMLEFAEKKAGSVKSDNITFINAGFLTYRHTEEPVDLVVSQLALHHLPDFWKMVALLRMNQMLKMGGKLFLSDIIFSFGVDCFEESISSWLDQIGESGGAKMMHETEMHIREEYSTFSWVMEDMLSRSGFSINKIDRKSEFVTAYICTKR
ncbi:MAG: class I SAM-dependent methyltransferase [Halobacteriota archaeon]|nr:class I SAM-dependent methyltransferase [Halobacteriota archaeon]